MLCAERHRAILQLLADQGRVTVGEIARRFEISTATARRDAMLLADVGKAARSHGGLVPASFFRGEPSLRNGVAPPMGTKFRMARCAADLLPQAGNVFIDTGTTCLEVGRLLLERPELRVFTNSISLLALAPGARATLLSIGGEMLPPSFALTGRIALAGLAQLRFDAAVVGAASLDLAGGAHASDLRLAAIKTEALRRSALRVLVAAAAKWTRPAAVPFAPWNAFTDFVTSREIPRDARHTLAAAQLALHVM